MKDSGRFWKICFVLFYPLFPSSSLFYLYFTHLKPLKTHKTIHKPTAPKSVYIDKKTLEKYIKNRPSISQRATNSTRVPDEELN